LLSDAVQASRCFQRTQHTQTEAITLKVGNDLQFQLFLFISNYVTKKMNLNSDTMHACILKFSSHNNYKFKIHYFKL